MVHRRIPLGVQQLLLVKTLAVHAGMQAVVVVRLAQAVTAVVDKI
jgi:hypothetical protein